jgi:hypothetical protein
MSPLLNIMTCSSLALIKKNMLCDIIVSAIDIFEEIV